MTLIRRLKRDRSGATALEFAMVAPLLLALIFLVIEGSRFLWTRQAVQEAAAHTARCVAIGSDGCDTAEGAKTFAVGRASKMGVSVPSTAVAIATGQTCHGVTEMNRVNLDIPFNSPLGDLLPIFPERLTAEACFPSLQ